MISSPDRSLTGAGGIESPITATAAGNPGSVGGPRATDADDQADQESETNDVCKFGRLTLTPLMAPLDSLSLNGRASPNQGNRENLM